MADGKSTETEGEGDDMYGRWMDGAMARKDAEAGRFFEVYFEEEALRSKDTDKRHEATRKLLKVEWKRCTLLCITPRKTALGHAYLALYGHFGDWYLFERDGKGARLKADWLNMYLALFPGKRPEELFEKVTYAKESESEAYLP